ncbi:MAG: hypothetical protein II987_06240, partial [Clostridia bacterium]|nr:hypothetical protein [Clostridia bacterium]
LPSGFLVIPHPSFSPCGEKSTCTLAVPKIFCGIRLEYFDRGAKPCSLFRPLGSLRRLCSLGRLPSGIPVCGGSKAPALL